MWMGGRSEGAGGDWDEDEGKDAARGEEARTGWCRGWTALDVERELLRPPIDGDEASEGEESILWVVRSRLVGVRSVEVGKKGRGGGKHG